MQGPDALRRGPRARRSAAAVTLAKFKVPALENMFFHAEELPKGATGKLDKKGLRDHYGKVVEARPLKASL